MKGKVLVGKGVGFDSYCGSIVDFGGVDEVIDLFFVEMWDICEDYN